MGDAAGIARADGLDRGVTPFADQRPVALILFVACVVGEVLRDANIRWHPCYHLRNTLEGLAYWAHQESPASDGRGLLDRYRVRGAFEDLFKQFELDTGLAAVKAELVLGHLERESGLLLGEGGGLYGLPHLSYEQYLAGCHIGQQATFHALAYEHWQRDPERWSEVIFLSLGRMVRGTGRETAASWLEFLLRAAL